MNENFLSDLAALYSNPLVKNMFMDYFTRMQQEGAQAAAKLFNTAPAKKDLFGMGPDVFEKMAEFYSGFGCVPRKKYDEVMEENEALKKENSFLKEVVQKMNLKMFEEGSRGIQEAWQEGLAKQLEMSKDMAKTFFDLFKDIKK
ncbi:hypothetical protein [Candidatus Magnetominusculus xianensis]|uniref:Phasin family protein n=1 Tax=Candidatus Magnetominusculus xianensis TaxID=1748249 RepID=A0ABR5SDY4_9BACT|nr:hypothetical protein [Candidatus Magnetominusculus xianensis]KWT83692.1 hypothetical protein ASN18_2143 [Candidatus Magnetominusculus xianensis]MBF0402610.1 hypothetical protein [Nitrospirota bacterium]